MSVVSSNRLCLLFWNDWGCSGLTGTSLVTPTGETRTNSLIWAQRPETETRALQSQSHYLKAETHTALLCNAESLLHFHASALPLFFPSCRKHTDRLLDKERERERCVSPGRAAFRCARRANTWTSVCFFLSFSLFFLSFLCQEKAAAEIRQELCRIRCIWLENKKQNRPLQCRFRTKCVWVLEKMLRLSLKY